MFLLIELFIFVSLIIETLKSGCKHVSTKQSYNINDVNFSVELLFDNNLRKEQILGFFSLM